MNRLSSKSRRAGAGRREQPIIGDHKHADVQSTPEERGGGLVERAEHDERQVLDQHEEPEGHDDRILVLALDAFGVERRQEQPLEADAENEQRRHGRDHGQSRRQAEGSLNGVVGEVAAQHVEHAVAEVHDLQHGKDQRQPGRRQGVDEADDHAVGHLQEDVVHPLTPCGDRRAAPA